MFDNPTPQPLSVLHISFRLNAHDANAESQVLRAANIGHLQTLYLQSTHAPFPFAQEPIQFD